MNRVGRAWVQSSSHRGARAAIVSLALCIGACHDAVLALSDVHAPARTAEAGAGGAGTDAGEGGYAGEVELAGSAGAESGERSLDASGFCGDAHGDCLYEHGRMECSGEVGDSAVLATSGERARLVIDMRTATELRLSFELCDPRGYVLNIGDSPSNNGGGGDAGDFQHDAEILIYGADLTASSSDLGYEQTAPRTGYHPFLLSRAGYVNQSGCSVRTLRLRDQYIADGEDPSLRTQSPTALRIHPSEDEEGAPDARWYIGLNRVVSSSLADRFRVGSGLVTLRLCFGLAPPEEPPRAGP